MTLTQALLLPAFVHVALVFYIGFRMGRARFAAAQAGKVKVRDIALDNSRWPDDVLKFQNNFNNQFQVPVLWYALLPLLLVTAKADWLTVALSWAFVASRIAHSVIHTGTNVVLNRFRAFVIGFTLVALMWAWFALRLYVIG
jgi:hypothetical protein